MNWLRIKSPSLKGKTILPGSMCKIKRLYRYFPLLSTAPRNCLNNSFNARFPSKHFEHKTQCQVKQQGMAYKLTTSLNYYVAASFFRCKLSQVPITNKKYNIITDRSKHLLRYI